MAKNESKVSCFCVDEKSKQNNNGSSEENGMIIRIKIKKLKLMYKWLKMDKNCQIIENKLLNRNLDENNEKGSKTRHELYEECERNKKNENNSAEYIPLEKEKMSIKREPWMQILIKTANKGYLQNSVSNKYSKYSK